ncbi:SGNH/GDSL hydrolase family protein [Subsaximicrobium wynnwilliamsii]|uniref:SGNH/GDSL hydrolase family protein n=1 Tax=Subsaximicrobium wynnwilliamsii TaxID=291179 RepID=A0A5C6ZG12_9FLAO|nr:SGNH/GDSL hydrolase family protein [Subsaximicrobium wynnwilliamsii]TXD82574.1 SGNH/GDSL hydrolase family protein [Subsaximicrobium wynnwilliamsii]TXD88217.1 SGNH/GDSL hydrolase family protein [Subsaximicrobium wynnwilliamsii]TXE02232.1 SGNH/GDSL hydrolase family protein [Subsaximicrobium wynnwilliamsii]
MKKNLLIIFTVGLISSCSSSGVVVKAPIAPTDISIDLLALGDSYTVGESVCDSCSFPEQLKDSLLANITSDRPVNLRVIAKSGYTTTKLKNAIASAEIANSYDIATLMIGVNNQYQDKSLSIYKKEFSDLVQTAIRATKGDKDKVIVLSIPDYGFTPYGQNSGNAKTIFKELNVYNTIAENYCEAQGVTFLNITDITRQGIQNPDLVASDGLHPSKLAYARFVARMIPIVLQKLD